MFCFLFGERKRYRCAVWHGASGQFCGSNLLREIEGRERVGGGNVFDMSCSGEEKVSRFEAKRRLFARFWDLLFELKFAIELEVIKELEYSSNSTSLASSGSPIAELEIMVLMYWHKSKHPPTSPSIFALERQF